MQARIQALEQVNTDLEEQVETSTGNLEDVKDRLEQAHKKCETLETQVKDSKTYAVKVEAKCLHYQDDTDELDNQFRVNSGFYGFMSSIDPRFGEPQRTDYNERLYMQRIKDGEKPKTSHRKDKRHREKMVYHHEYRKIRKVSKKRTDKQRTTAYKFPPEGCFFLMREGKRLQRDPSRVDPQVPVEDLHKYVVWAGSMSSSSESESESDTEPSRSPPPPEKEDESATEDEEEEEEEEEDDHTKSEHKKRTDHDDDDDDEASDTSEDNSSHHGDGQDRHEGGNSSSDDDYDGPPNDSYSKYVENTNSNNGATSKSSSQASKGGKNLTTNNEGPDKKTREITKTK